MWLNVVRHFSEFIGKLELPPTVRRDAEGKAERVARSLFAEYYPDQDFDPRCYGIVGSYGKGTAANPKSDVDMIFAIPSWEFQRIDAVVHNKQSYLLQEVKDIVLGTFPNTDIRGDGPVVKVPFSTYEFEVCPVFQLTNGSFINAHTRNGGRWGHTHPGAEINWLHSVDARSSSKATHLVRMLKAWQRECNVDIRSICLETLAILFVDQWHNRDQQTLLWYDWMVRDFFAYAHQFSSGGIIKPAGIDEWISVGEWQTKCVSAYYRAKKACEYEYEDKRELANAEWQKIFGSQFRTNLMLPIPPPPPLYAGLLSGRA